MATREMNDGWRIASRRRRATPGSAPVRALTASAVRIDPDNRVEVRRQRSVRQNWQLDSFVYRNSVPELRYGVNFMANCAAMMDVFVGVLPEGNETDTPVDITKLEGVPPELIEACENALRDLGNGRTEMSGHMKQLSANIQLPGEAILLGQEDIETMKTTWSVRSISEIVVYNDRLSLCEGPIDSTGQLGIIPLDANLDTVSRMWQPDIQFRLLADSPMKALSSTCEDLLINRRGIRATGRSRLAGAGLMLIPDNISVPVQTDDDMDPTADPVVAAIANAMMSPITDEGVASAVVPIIIRGPADALSAVKWIEVGKGYDAAAMAVRSELKGDLATGLDMPKEVIEGVVDLNHWPVDETTEVFTIDRGFVTHDQLNAGDLVLSLNHVTGQTQWAVLTGVRREYVTDREMVRVLTPSLDALTTLDHRWPILRDGERLWTDSENLAPTDRIIRAAPHQGLPEFAKYSDAFVQLVAWYSADGTAIGSTPQVRIGKSHKENPDKVARLRGIFTELFGPAREGKQPRQGIPRSGDSRAWWKEDVQERGMTLFCPNKAASAELLGVVPGKDKSVPRDFIMALTHSQLLLFLQAFADADGTLRDSGGLSINQRVSERLASVELAAILLGRPVQFYDYAATGGYADGVQHHISVPIQRGYDVPVNETSRETYTGIIFCPQVPPAASFLARRNGKVYYTGNSAWQVSDDVFRHHVKPHVEVLVDCFTDGYLRPYIATSGLPEEIIDAWLMRLLFWYNPAKLVTHPDQTANATLLHAALAISDQAYRRVLGFSEDDAPDSVEIEVRMIRTTRTYPPNLLMALMHALDPELAVPPITVTGTVPGIKPGLSGGADVPPPPPVSAPGATPAPDAIAGTEPSETTPAPVVPGPPPITAAGALATLDEKGLKVIAAIESMSHETRVVLRRVLRNEFIGRYGIDPYFVTKEPPTEKKPLTAAGTTDVKPSAKSIRLSRQLQQIDADLRTRLIVAANAQMFRNLERAGSRLRQKVNSNKDLREAIKMTRNEHVMSVLGRDAVVASGVVVEKDWDTLKEQWDTWVPLAQKRAVATAAQLAGIDEEDANVSSVVAMSEGATAGWLLLRESMDTLAQNLGYNPDPNISELDALAALNPDTLVPTGTIRCALALAGGGTKQDFGLITTKDGAVVPAIPLGVPLPGIGTGATVGGILTNAGAVTSVYEWVHGPTDKPFQPHLDLDGQEFSSFTDPILVNDTGFPQNSYFLPGDHSGCVCDATPMWITQDDVDAATASADAQGL